MSDPDGDDFAEEPLSDSGDLLRIGIGLIIACLAGLVGFLYLLFA